MPRRARAHEHVDDHQEELADLLDRLGLVVRVEDRIAATDVEAARSGGFAGLASLAALPSVGEALAGLLAGGRRGRRKR
jgi:UDP-N-acetylglucosamine transferase subunit ALG13